MKLKVVLFLFVLLAMAGTSLRAQSNILDINDLSSVKVDMLNDEQIKAVKSKAEELKLSDAELLKMLTERGLQESESLKLKSRLSMVENSPVLSQKNPEVNQEDNKKKKTNDNKVEERKDDMMRDNDKDITVFGSELFLKNSLVFEPNLRIPTPSSYILGPDDEIIINIFGVSEKKYNLQVSEEGEIYIPNVGPVFVNGLSIEQATQKIKQKLTSTIYRAMASGQTQLQITLGKIRTIRVTVIGQAEKPGTYTVSSYTTLYNLLYLCGGPQKMGSYRTIELIRANKLKKTADLYSFLVKGNQTDNVLLQEGDIVRIPYFNNMISISGQVKRQGKYEMLDSESVKDLMTYCGGFDAIAHKNSITDIRITDTGKTVIDITADKFAHFTLQNGDSIVVNKNHQRFVNKITLSGYVARPGLYEISEGLDLEKLIAKAGGLLTEAYTGQITIYRYYKNRVPAILSVNLDSVQLTGQKVLLQSDDQVVVNSIFDFKDNMYVSVEGNVRNPIRFKWREDLSLKDVILAAGGISEKGDSSKIEISRRIISNDGGATNENETFITSLNSNIALKPFDFVIVRNKLGLVPTRAVMVVGEVKVPGKYILEKSNERITDIIRRVEGFRNSADSGIITIRRNVESDFTDKEREKIFQRLLNIDPDSISNTINDDIVNNKELISIDLKEILAHPELEDNLILEDGDIITINKNRNLVKISGEVYYPTVIPVNPTKNARYYIWQAGNFTSLARKSGTVVVYPDGKAKKVKRFLFFRSYPKVTARSEIFVPQKQKDNRNKMGAGEWAVLISALGIVSNVIISALKK